jgi:hypothetical protein
MNFPDPNVTTEYESPDGLKYIWNGFAWEIECGGAVMPDVSGFVTKEEFETDQERQDDEIERVDQGSKARDLLIEAEIYAIMQRQGIQKITFINSDNPGANPYPGYIIKDDKTIAFNKTPFDPLPHAGDELHLELTSNSYRPQKIVSVSKPYQGNGSYELIDVTCKNVFGLETAQVGDEATFELHTEGNYVTPLELEEELEKHVLKAGDHMTGDLTVGDEITLGEDGNIYAKQFNRVYVGNGRTNDAGYDKTNTAVGMLCLDKNQGGFWNTGVGYQALAWLTTGKENVAVGYAAGSGYSSGSQNVALGYKALYGVTSGENNVGIGWNSGYYFEGSDNTIIGAYKGGAGDKELNKTVIISAGPTARARCAENGDWTFYEKVIMRRTPTEDNHVANKEYVDDQIAALTARLNRLEGNG